MILEVLGGAAPRPQGCDSSGEVGGAAGEESCSVKPHPYAVLLLSLPPPSVLQGLPAAVIRPEKPLLTFLIPYLCLTADAKLRSHSF